MRLTKKEKIRQHWAPPTEHLMFFDHSTLEGDTLMVSLTLTSILQLSLYIGYRPQNDVPWLHANTEQTCWSDRSGQRQMT